MSTCPWCHSETDHLYLKVKDYFLSQEEFEIYCCPNCQLLFTSPRPAPEKIGVYYKSENYYSHQENKHGIIPRIYEAVKTRNLQYKTKLALGDLPVGNLLDIGCGVGDFLLQAHRQGWNIQGIEPSEDAGIIACKKLGFLPLKPNQSNTLPDASFDVITMWHVLEHVDDLPQQILELRRLLKPNGRLLIAVPNFKSFDATYYKALWAAWDVPRHLNHFSVHSIDNILSSNGFSRFAVDKLPWDAYYISYLSEKYQQHSLPLVRGAFVGLRSNVKAWSSNQYSSMVYRYLLTNE